MNRRIASLAIVASLLLAVGACTKANDTTTTNTQAQTPTTAATGNTSGGGSTSDTKATGTTRGGGSTGTTRGGGSTGTTSKSGGGGGGGGGGMNFSATQQQCFATAAQELATSNPEALEALGALGQSGANLTPAQALLLGNLIVGCVPKTELAASLVQGLKSSPEGSSLDQEGLDCIEKQILSLDSEELAVFIAVLAVAGQSGDKSAIAPIISKLNSACNTNIPA